MTCTLASCSEEYLTIPADGKETELIHYKDESQAFAGLVAAYDPIRKILVVLENMITMMDAGSDDQYAGGGGETDGIGIQSFSNYSQSGFTVPRSFGVTIIKGIFRTNILVKKLQIFLWMLQKKQDL